MKTLVFVFSVLCAAGLSADILSITPVPQGGADTNNWCWKRFREKQQLVKAGGSEVVFMGDSITHGWEGAGKEVWKKYYGTRRAYNFGIGGDRTTHVLWRLENTPLEKIAPKMIVVMIGTNNRNTPEETAGGIEEIVRVLE
jgi:hypothetical protein